MQFETERLILRPWTENDAEDLFTYAKDPRVGSNAGWKPHPDPQHSLEIIKTVLSGPETYAVCLKSDCRAIGSVGLFPYHGSENVSGKPDEAQELEIGYWLGVPFWGQGLIPEAVRCLQKYAFAVLGCSIMWCSNYSGNHNSERVQEKCGFTYHHTEEDSPGEQIHEVRTVRYSRITRDEWKRLTGCAD